jgi:hypothetical protein
VNLLTTQDLFSVGLNTDGISGFEAQLALKTARVNAVPPQYLMGPRVDKFEEGAAVARSWMEHRSSTGIARRRARLQERKAGGFITTIRPRGNAERRREQLEALEEVAARRTRVAAILAQEKGA